jgi:hypothetical protein
MTDQIAPEPAPNTIDLPLVPTPDSDDDEPPPPPPPKRAPVEEKD